MLKIAICDDEDKYMQYIKNHINRELSQKNYECSCYLFSNGDDLINLCSMEKIDVIFLDIEMPNISGDIVANKIRSINSDVLIIFVTSHDEMVFSMLKYTPFRFIRKDKFEDEISEAINAVINEILKNDRTIFLQTENGFVNVKLSEIMYFDAYGHDVFCYTINNPYKLYMTSLDKIEKEMPINNFIRVHRSYLVNFQHIYSIYKENIILKNSDFKVPLSKHRKENVKKQLMFYTNNN